MGRRSDYTKIYQKNENKVYEELDKTKEENKRLKLEVALLKAEVQRLNLVIEKNKINNDKDCTCSSIPSSKNHFKKGISNSRKPSNKSIGAQQKHKGHFLSKSKIEKLLENPKTKVIKKKINYTKKAKNQKPIKRYKIGFEIVPVLYEYEIYPNEFGKYVIPKDLQAQVQYSNEIKTLAMALYYESNVSTDNISVLFNDLFKYKISKGSIVNWERELESDLMQETGHIMRCLKEEEYVHADDSQINVHGETYNVHNVSSNTHTMQWVHKNKGHNAILEIGFIPDYEGIIVKDGTHVYDKFNTNFVSCGAHINRYLIGANKGIFHQGEESLLMFFAGLKRRRKSLQRKGLSKVSNEEYKNIAIQYEFILNEWYKEIKKDQKTNPCYDDERKLQARLLTDENQHLKFMTNFSLPYTNNRAETDLRDVKERQKVGIFRNEESADRYATIKSCISTYRKNKVNIFEAIEASFNKETIIV